MIKPDKDNLTIIHYTANFLETANPFFLKNTQEQLLRAIGDLPMIIVSQKPTMFGDNTTNICVGDIGRSHLNIWKQILIGAKAAKTKYIAMAEDDILYSYEHFHSQVPDRDIFLYDMNRISLFTWSRPPIFSYRHKRMVINQLIAPRELYIKAFEERYAKFPDESKIDLHHFAEPGRYEHTLGVTVQPTDTFMCKKSSIVFTHEYAYGYMYNHGKRKAQGDLRMFEVQGWPRAEVLLNLFYKDGYV